MATLALLLGTCTVSRFTRHKPDPAPMANSFETIPARDEAAAVEAPVEAPANEIEAAPPPAASSADARQPNRWYYVPRLGDGPGVIFSRTGGGWDYAFACTAATQTIEFIAVNVGDPAGFDQQYMRVGRAKLMMDATYSKDGHGTIITKLPARHPFFNAFVGADPSLELKLFADRTVTIPIGPEVLRLIRDCGGEPAAPAAEAGRNG